MILETSKRCGVLLGGRLIEMKKKSRWFEESFWQEANHTCMVNTFSIRSLARQSINLFVIRIKRIDYECHISNCSVKLSQYLFIGLSEV